MSALVVKRAPRLPHGDHQPVEIGGDDQPRLATCQCQDRAILVGQHDSARAGANRNACSCSPVNAVHIGWPSDVADCADEIGCGAAKRKAVAYPADGEPIALAMKHQCSAAGGAADDKTGFDDVEPYAAAIGVDAGRAGYGHGQSNQRGTKRGWQSHEKISTEGISDETLMLACLRSRLGRAALRNDLR